MNSDVTRQMHQEHSEWRSEDNFWRDEVRAWQRELSDVFGDIGELASRLKLHHDLLCKHAAAIRLYEDAPARHEHTLAESERSGMPERVIGMAAAHDDEADRHQVERSEHARIKERQHSIMTHWNGMMHTLNTLQK